MLAALCLSHTGDDTTFECATTANAAKYCKNAQSHSQTVHSVHSRKKRKELILFVHYSTFINKRNCNNCDLRFNLRNLHAQFS